MIFVITESCLPVPCSKIVSKLTQITIETAGELVIMGCNFVGTQPRFQSSVAHAGRELRSGRHSTYSRLWMARVRSSRGRVIRYCEWIEWILNRHANARRAAAMSADAGSIYPVSYAKGVTGISEYIQSKWSWRHGAIPETAHVFEITKKLQVLLTKLGIERAVEVFTIHRGHCRS